MPTITITDRTSKSLRAAALSQGVDESTLAEEILANGLQHGAEPKAEPMSKPYRALQFSGVAPSGRTAAEIDDEINKSRDEWDSGN